MGAAHSNFETIWRTYEKELSSYVLSRVGDSEIQKEIMQEAALKIYTSLHMQKDHLRGWLYRIVKNAMADYFRKQGKPLPQLGEPVQEESYPLTECLKPMMARLSKQEQEILELTQIQQYCLRDVAEQRKIPLNTAKSQLFRAKNALAKRLFSCCEYERNAKGEVTDFTDLEGVCK